MRDRTQTDTLANTSGLTNNKPAHLILATTSTKVVPYQEGFLSNTCVLRKHVHYCYITTIRLAMTAHNSKENRAVHLLLKTRRT